MYLKMWGTRGSLPRATTESQFVETTRYLIERAKEEGIEQLDAYVESLAGGRLARPVVFGGNTTCFEFRQGDHCAFVDMGTGITDACAEAMAEGRREFHIFQTHLHWDHIMGLPFFVPIYIPGNKVTIHHLHRTAPEFIQIQFNGTNFPVKWEDLGAEIEFKLLKLYEPVEHGAMTFTPFALDHPGGSFGYRVSCGNRSVTIGCDGEYKRMSPQELGKDLPFYQKLDALVFDGQYEMNELAHRFDWGHSSPTIGVDLALREGIRNLYLTHHDPRTPDSKARKMYEHAKRHVEQHIEAHRDVWDRVGQPEGPRIHPAYDGLTIDCDSI